MSHETHQLAELLRHKHQVLTRLAVVVARQLELIAGGDWTGLMRELSAKSRWVDALCDAERRWIRTVPTTPMPNLVRHDLTPGVSPFNDRMRSTVG